MPACHFVGIAKSLYHVIPCDTDALNLDALFALLPSLQSRIIRDQMTDPSHRPKLSFVLGGAGDTYIIDIAKEETSKSPREIRDTAFQTKRSSNLHMIMNLPDTLGEKGL